MTTIEIILGVLLILLSVITVIFAMNTKGDGQGLNAISGKGGGNTFVSDANLAISKTLKWLTVAVMLLIFICNVINAHSLIA